MNVYQFPKAPEPPKRPTVVWAFCDRCKFTVDLSTRPDMVTYWANGLLHICECTKPKGA